MVIFLLPLSFFRFFWWRFNVWGELAAVVLGLPLSILVWFVLDFQNTAVHPMWQGLGLLFGMSFLTLTTVSLLTPAESPKTLIEFYRRCRPPGFWAPVRRLSAGSLTPPPRVPRLLADSGLGILACLGLVLASNALFVGNWLILGAGIATTLCCGTALVRRIVQNLFSSRPADEPLLAVGDVENQATTARSFVSEQVAERDKGSNRP
jgi:hypothetical protein